jgi:hypothetical protein
MTDYGYLRVDNTSNYAYVGNGTGTTAPEKFLAYDPRDPSRSFSIGEGNYTLLRNLETGLWCRLAVYNTSTASSTAPYRPRKGSFTRGLLAGNGSVIVWGCLCDQPTASTATEFQYSRRGLMYQGVPMVAQAMFYPLLWSNTTPLPGSGSLSVTTLPTSEWCLPPDSSGRGCHVAR